MFKYFEIVVFCMVVNRRKVTAPQQDRHFQMATGTKLHKPLPRKNLGLSSFHGRDIYADRRRRNLGLSTRKNAPSGSTGK